jgi:hypothetical protein
VPTVPGRKRGAGFIFVLDYEPSRYDIEDVAFIAPMVCPSSPYSGPDKAKQLCLGTSDLDFLPDLNGIVNLDAKVANSAIDLRVAQHELDRI